MAIKLYNKAMERKLTSGQAIDLSRCPRKGDFYVLTKVVDGMDIAAPKPSNGFGQSAAIERPAKFSRRAPTSFLIIEISNVFGCDDYHQTKARL